MANPQHLEIVKAGAKAIRAWRQETPNVALNLFAADLAKIDLRGVNLTEADLTNADLGWADLTGALLSQAKLNNARLSGARLNQARLIGASLHQADMRHANLTKANLRYADLRGANLNDANLTGIKLRGANLQGADLSESNLTWAKLIDANLNETDLRDAQCGWTVFADVDLSTARGLDTVLHRGPSSVGVDSLTKSNGRIAPEFLRGCGLFPWQIAQSRLGDPALSADEIRELQDEVTQQRIGAASFRGGVFIAHSVNDAEFVDKLYQRLRDAGISVWLDGHETETSPLQKRPVQKQISAAIHDADSVILVLSAASSENDWVEHELEGARRRELSAQRDLLCPVALDDSWKARLIDTSWKAKLEDVLWRHNKTKNVMDFSGWRTDDFEKLFPVLLENLSIRREPAGGATT